jgi:hypothetical protein
MIDCFVSDSCKHCGKREAPRGIAKIGFFYVCKKNWILALWDVLEGYAPAFFGGAGGGFEDANYDEVIR